MNNKPNLPDGWIQFRTKGSTIYRHPREGLTVQKIRTNHWRLVHQQKDTGHRFTTAQDAIGYAEDARMHGG